MEVRKKLKGRSPVGKTLAKLRIDLDETLGQMADKLGVHSVHLSKVENGTVNFSLELANKVHSVYGVDLKSMVSEVSKRLVFKADEVPTDDWNILLEIRARIDQGKAVTTPGTATVTVHPTNLALLPITNAAPVKPAQKVVPDVDGVDFIDDLDDLDDLSDLD
jgi:transcriptional regulator with XRE-family HTH domain